MFIQQKRTAKFGLLLSRIFKKTLKRNADIDRTHGTHGTSGTSMNLRVHISNGGVHTHRAATLPIPALTSSIPQPQPAALHARLRHIARLRTTHAHSMSTGTTHVGRAGKARKQSARMQAAWGCAIAQGGGHYMRARQGYGSPCARWRLVRELEHGSSDDEQDVSYVPAKACGSTRG